MKIIPLEEFDAVELLEGLRREPVMGAPHPCRFKRRFEHESRARSALAKIRAHGDRREKKPVRVYACDDCHGYHLTSDPL